MSDLTADDLFPPPTAADDARTRVDRAIWEAANLQDGTGAFQTHPAFPGASTTVRRPKALPAVRAARLVASVAQGRLSELIREARGDGASWSAIGEALRLQPEGVEYERAEAAYRYAVGPEPDPDGDYLEWSRWRDRKIHWRCRSCDRYITDSGPYNPHPADQEAGHAADCERFRDEVQAYEQHIDEWDQVIEDGSR